MEHSKATARPLARSNMDDEEQEQLKATTRVAPARPTRDDEEQELLKATARDPTARAIIDDEEEDLKATARVALASAIMNLL
eukprot:12958171-Heterocapsa_arctica.AAC.1